MTTAMQRQIPPVNAISSHAAIQANSSWQMQSEVCCTAHTSLVKPSHDMHDVPARLDSQKAGIGVEWTTCGACFVEVSLLAVANTGKQFAAGAERRIVDRRWAADGVHAAHAGHFKHAHLPVVVAHK